MFCCSKEAMPQQVSVFNLNTFWWCKCEEIFPIIAADFLFDEIAFFDIKRVKKSSETKLKILNNFQILLSLKFPVFIVK